MGGKSKGSAYEREIAKRFSRWWSNEERDDVFWRTDNSGGRATTRAKSGVKTFGQCGDLQASDPIGQPLMDLCVIEIKRGYKEASIGDMLDAPDSAKQKMFGNFIEQVITDFSKSQSLSWMLITKRDRREELVTMPLVFRLNLVRNSGEDELPIPYSTNILHIKSLKQIYHLVTYRLDYFFETYNSNIVKRTIKNWETVI